MAVQANSMTASAIQWVHTSHAYQISAGLLTTAISPADYDLTCKLWETSAAVNERGLTIDIK